MYANISMFVLLLTSFFKRNIYNSLDYFHDEDDDSLSIVWIITDDCI